MKGDRQKELEIRTTHDGSSTLFVPSLNENYHSIFGARQESEHVYIQKGLDYLLEQNPQLTEVNIIEFGFGTGLNALLAWNWAEQHQIKVGYTTVELFPIPMTIIEQLTFSEIKQEQQNFLQLHACDWETSTLLSPYFTMLKREGEFEQVELKDSAFQCCFFDAFAPNKQADPWEESVFQKVRRILDPNGILVTYCARGHVKRSMISAGLLVEKVPGPPGKREMFRATPNPDFGQEPSDLTKLI